MQSNETRLLAYNIVVQRYNISQEIPREELCNGITITNVGDTNLTINGIILFASPTPATDQGDSISIGGNEGEIYKGNLTLSFIQPVGAAPLVEVIQKYYVQIKK